MQKSNVLELLNAGAVDLSFTKVDGSTRQMLATLSEDIVPSRMNPADSNRYEKNAQSVCAVWDMTKNSWRSFRWESVIEVNGTNTKITG